jgi:hypothetical protein
MLWAKVRRANKIPSPYSDLLDVPKNNKWVTAKAAVDQIFGIMFAEF